MRFPSSRKWPICRARGCRRLVPIGHRLCWPHSSAPPVEQVATWTFHLRDLDYPAEVVSRFEDQLRWVGQPSVSRLPSGGLLIQVVAPSDGWPAWEATQRWLLDVLRSVDSRVVTAGGAIEWRELETRHCDW